MDDERQTIGHFDLRVARHRRSEDSDRPTIVLTNAFPQSIRCWESTWDRLGERADLLAVDLAGFGRSSGSGDVMRPSAQAELLAEVMDHNDVGHAFLVGPDIGAPVTLWLASSHPDRVLGVNVFDGPATWPTDFDPALAAATRSRVVRWLGTRGPMQRRLMRQNFAAATEAGYHHFSPSPEATVLVPGWTLRSVAVKLTWPGWSADRRTAITWSGALAKTSRLKVVSPTWYETEVTAELISRSRR